MASTALAGRPHLVHFRISHYNEKVRWALDLKRWPHTREARTPGLHIPRARWLTGQNKLPILVLDGTALCGSDRILREIEARRPDPPLFPVDPAQRARAAELERFYDDEVAPALRRLVWACYLDRPADVVRMATDGASPFVQRVWPWLLPLFRPLFRRNMGIDAVSLATARDRLVSYADRIEQELEPSGYLVGTSFGVADLAVASVMTAILRPPEFPYPLPEPWPPALLELKGALASRPGAQWVLDVYAKHRPRSSEVSPSAPW